MSECGKDCFYVSMVCQGVVSFLLNLLLLFAFIRFRRPLLESTDNKLLCSMTFADLLVGIHAILYGGLLLHKAEPVIYKALAILPMFTSMFASITSLTCITINRLIAVKRPLRYHAIVTPERLIMLFVLIWSIPGLVYAAELIVFFLSSSKVELQSRSYLTVIFFTASSAALIASNALVYAAVKRQIRLIASQTYITHHMKTMTRIAAGKSISQVTARFSPTKRGIEGTIKETDGSRMNDRLNQPTSTKTCNFIETNNHGLKFKGDTSTTCQPFTTNEMSNISNSVIPKNIEFLQDGHSTKPAFNDNSSHIYKQEDIPCASNQASNQDQERLKTLDKIDNTDATNAHYLPERKRIVSGKGSRSNTFVHNNQKGKTADGIFDNGVTISPQGLPNKSQDKTKSTDDLHNNEQITISPTKASFSDVQVKFNFKNSDEKIENNPNIIKIRERVNFKSDVKSRQSKNGSYFVKGDGSKEIELNNKGLCNLGFTADVEIVEENGYQLNCVNINDDSKSSENNENEDAPRKGRLKDTKIRMARTLSLALNRVRFRRTNSVQTSKQNLDMAHMCILAVLAFIICWSPLTIYRCRYLIGMEPITWFRRLALFLAAGNSMVNPCIYLYKQRTLRKYLKLLLSRKKATSK